MKPLEMLLAGGRLFKNTESIAYRVSVAGGLRTFNPELDTKPSTLNFKPN